MKIVAGLGNPGLRYRMTRHNAGFMVIRLLAREHGLRIRKRGCDARYARGTVGSREVILLEPRTFVNRSGRSVIQAMRNFGVDGSGLLVVNDDVDLPLGTIRLKRCGSSGGHNGLKSIIGEIGRDFNRLRLGVGPVDDNVDTAEYVLSSFRRRERPVLDEMLRNAVRCVETWLSEGPERAMDLYNR